MWWAYIHGGGAYIWNEVSVSTCGGLIHGGMLIFGGLIFMGGGLILEVCDSYILNP